MPYTISHVAAVVPAARPLLKWGMLSATVIGSMAPDFGYLMPDRPPRFETHSALALVTFCLPVGMVAFWVFQWLIKTPLMSVLPDQAYMRWRPYAAPAAWNSPRQWLLTSVGILAGAITHLAWDGFTHEDGRGVRMVPELSDPLLEVHGHLLTGARFLQGLSSLLGLVIVIAAIIYALRGTSRLSVVPRVLATGERRLWTIVWILMTIGFGAGFLLLDSDEGGYHLLRIGQLSIALLRALAPAALCFSVLMQGYLRWKR
jgi:hypothetical protein